MGGQAWERSRPLVTWLHQIAEKSASRDLLWYSRWMQIVVTTYCTDGG
jgi:hypothetical protein